MVLRSSAVAKGTWMTLLSKLSRQPSIVAYCFQSLRNHEWQHGVLHILTLLAEEPATGLKFVKCNGDFAFIFISMLDVRC